MMRVLGAYANNGVTGSKSAGRARSGGSVFSVPQESSQTQASAQTSQAQAVQNVDALLALQSVDDALSSKKRRAVRRGHKMLDLLEDVRLGLLSGSLPAHILHQLESFSQDYELSGDERIDQLLSEISLRAQVELAKLENSAKRL